MTNNKIISVKDLRSFAFIMGAIFSLVGLWPEIMREDGHIRMWALILGGTFLATGLLAPTWLTPIYRIWMKIGAGLGWINTRIILSLGFYGILTPIGVFMRLRKKDPMRRTFDPYATTYKVSRKVRPGSHMERQF